MKLKVLACVTTMTILAVLALPPQCLAEARDQKLPQYTVVDLGTLGGTFSETQGDNALGGEWVTGDSGLPNDTVLHAFLWHRGRIRDLGTLGGPNSFGWGVNESGNAVGGADTSANDPLGEQYCFGAGDNSICLPFLWRNDIHKMIALPLLGGNNGAASGINSQGEVVGQAENANIDQTCVGTGSTQVLLIEAALWRNGKVHQLALIPGDAEGSAFAINDWGQVVGATSFGFCAAPEHAVLWQNGTAIDLGNLGGMNDNEAYAINDWGQVVGKSDVSGDTTFHAFLWRNGWMTDLGTLSNDSASIAFGISNTGQVVGNSYNASGNPRGFLWQWGVMTDLNTLIPSDSPLYLLTANGINDWGQIAGIAYESSSGEYHAYLATPGCGEAGSENTTAAATERPRATLPENARKLLQRGALVGRIKGGLRTTQ